LSSALPAVVAARETGSKDEMSLAYRLETRARKVLLEKSARRNASSDIEELATPPARETAETVSAAVPAARTPDPVGGPA
jgi:hypothetical protein